MKKILYAAAACALLASTACKTEKAAESNSTPAISELQGEWDITSVNGTTVSVPENQEAPFLGFEISEGALYGNAGCNSIMGSFSTNAEPGVIIFENTGSTRMMCPDMTIEDIVLPALDDVAKYSITESGTLELLNNSDSAVFILEKREPVAE